MKNPGLAPDEQAALDKQRETQPTKQPYATETDDRELESAHEQNRPVDPEAKPENPPVNSGARRTN